ncbi:homeobox-leucine zipper protein HOX10-like isoform X2 [Olea europaea var. sylvestris]|uniref:homeobox-leucine zipper protein HOX10-like isoform X2 n=1 Tax=Olea europaea var. sylvestris TaxID=158386 RepID=UPI000C1D3BF7|nr:homeobox-leucine zipper protein HOX10-like isoform X2 [Olea europaea var. sylvestris]
MEIIEHIVAESSNRGTGMGTGRPPRLEEVEKHVTYTDEQIELLEKIYVECPNPTRSQRSQIVQEHPILNGIENRQIKIWFQNCRCCERNKKEKEEFLLMTRNLRAINTMLVEENNLLQNEVAQKMQLRENLRNLLYHIHLSWMIVMQLIATASVADLGHETDAFPAANSRSIPLPAEETTNRFLSKATGTVTNWIADLKLKVFMVVMLFGLYLLVSNHLFNFRLSGAVHVLQTRVGEAARPTAAPFDPIKKLEILKDCPSWFPNCRNLEVLDKFLVNNGTTTELMYTQRDGQDTWLTGADSSKFRCLTFFMAYQFSFSIHLWEDVTSMAQPYVYHVLSQKNNSLKATSGSYLVKNSTEANPAMGSMFSRHSVDAANLAYWIGQSYRSSLGVEFLSVSCRSSDSLLDLSSFKGCPQYFLLVTA